MGWRYEPRIVFSGGRGAKLVDVDGNEYYDCNAGMMCLVLGHAHSELVETIREQAERFVHQSSWFTNPWAIELAELVASTLPDGLEVTNYAVTGSEANEIAMRMALGVTGGFDICTVVRGLHGGSLGAESATSVGGARKRGLGPLSLPAVTNCVVPSLLLPRAGARRGRLGRDQPSAHSRDDRAHHKPGGRRNTRRADDGGGWHDRSVAALDARTARDRGPLGRTADLRRGAARAGQDRRDVGVRALRRRAGHRHLGEGHVGGPSRCAAR